MPHFIGTDLDKPFTEAELEVLGLYVDSGLLLAFDVNQIAQAATANQDAMLGIVGEAPSSKVRNLLLAAPFMYRHVSVVYNMLQVLTDQLPMLALEPAVAAMFEHMFTEMQNRILEARRCAVIGPDALNKEITSQLLTMRKPKG